MKMFFKYAVLNAILICAFALPVYGVTARDNYLYFPGETVRGFSWHDTHHKITDGQPWEEIKSSYVEGKGILYIKAGREGSEDVAEWFKERASVDGAAKAIGTREDNNPPKWPDKLNFATNGHMTLKDTHGRTAQCRGLVIGQGHWGTFNNWWLAGRNLHEYDGEYWLVCPPVEDPLTGTFYCGAIAPISTGDSDLFPITLWMCPPAVSVSLSPDVLWPANGKMVEIEATISGADGCGSSPFVTLVSAVSSEPESDTHARDIPDDILGHDIGFDDRVFKVRAEHSGKGRTYTVIYDIVDGCGVERTLEATVTVPQNKSKSKKIK